LKNPSPFPWLSLSALLLLAPGYGANGARAATMDELCGLLKSRGVLIESGDQGRLAMEGLLKALDSEARVLTARDDGAIAGGFRAEAWPEGLAYLRLEDLQAISGKAAATQLVAWADAGRSGVIVDVRAAGGGSLSAVEELAGLFVPAGTPLCRVPGAAGGIRKAGAAAERLTHMPVMLLTDGQTRDACAVLAWAWRGRPGVMIIGAPTRSEPRAREFISLSDGKSVYIATGWVMEPSEDGGRLPSVTPDIAVSATDTNAPRSLPPTVIEKRTSAKALQDMTLMKNVSGDACLARATDILLGLKAVGARVAGLPPAAETNALPQ
jgi:C-terminal processing protease CtpA/Prc